jgi:hypothetical protein
MMFMMMIIILIVIGHGCEKEMVFSGVINKRCEGERKLN